VGSGRHDQDLELDRLAECVRGQRSGHLELGRQRRHDREQLDDRAEPDRGGGRRPLHREGGNVTVENSKVTKNQAANGGGLYSGGHLSQYGLRGRFDVRSSEISENKAENGGGIYNDGDAQLSVTDTKLTTS
jgi:predicted outer membrane repeat protein